MIRHPYPKAGILILIHRNIELCQSMNFETEILFVSMTQKDHNELKDASILFILALNQVKLEAIFPAKDDL